MSLWNGVQEVYAHVFTSLPPPQANQQMYFVSESALFELFRYAALYSDALLEALDEEGLTTMAHSFESIKDSLQSAQ